MRYPLETKRQVLAQIFICNGCCCGQTGKGNPPVPLEWLKAEFKARKLIRNVQITVSGCLGPCDVPNVVAILTPGEGMRWFGNLSEFWHYESLLDWAAAVKAAQSSLPVPLWLASHQLDPFSCATLSTAVA
ncbi:MAG: (2Fe-2S) ferredoxin domain-containing protein [Bryobacteraceae bacterium]|nr:(2Fe-2S) ferredoxin domain-containing protein [Bryobacteraceae bacterium]